MCSIIFMLSLKRACALLSPYCNFHVYAPIFLFDSALFFSVVLNRPLNGVCQYKDRGDGTVSSEAR